MMAASIALLAQNVQFGYGRQPNWLQVHRLQLLVGRSLFLHGASGSGKSTLLNLLAGTLVPRQGTIHVAGHCLSTLGGARRDQVRGDHLGFIFQQFNLLPFLSVLDNVLLPCRFSAVRRTRARQSDGQPAAAATRLLAQLGLGDRALLRRPAGRLSVGQQQRVAAARALIGQPAVILADEPTSALDADSQHDFLQVLFQECRQSQTALLFVSHDHRLAAAFDEVRELSSLAATADERPGDLGHHPGAQP